MARKDREWQRGKGEKGYKVQAYGKGREYLTITMPHGMGFRLGDRVAMKPMMIRGVYGVFITADEGILAATGAEAEIW
jgi:hypothetical protein